MGMRTQVYKIKKFVIDLFNYPEMQLHKIDYDTYWQSRRSSTDKVKMNSFQLFRAKWICERIQNEEKVLDIACGEGSILRYLIDHKKVDATGADISSVALNICKSHGITPYKLDLRDEQSLVNLPEVDHILMLEFLEHLANPEEFLLRVIKNAKSSVFFSFPNTGYIHYRLRLLFGRFPVQWRSHPGEHLRFWTYRDLKWWLKNLGIKNQCNVEAYEGPRLLNKIWPSLFAKAFVIQLTITK